MRLGEFRKAFRDAKIVFKRDTDVDVLFRLFDRDGTGVITYDAFLHAVRGVLSPRRRAVVRLAFTVLDRDGTGVLDPRDVIAAYDTSAHPDVRARTKTTDQALKEFVDAFDVGGVIDGKITLEEFENFYANLSPTVADDDAFEALVRGTWRIGGSSSGVSVVAGRGHGRVQQGQVPSRPGTGAGLRPLSEAELLARLQDDGDGYDDAPTSATSSSSSSSGGGGPASPASIVARLRSRADANRAARSPERASKPPPEQPQHVAAPPQRPAAAVDPLDIALAGPHAPNPPSSSSSSASAAAAAIARAPYGVGVSAGIAHHLATVQKDLKARGPAAYCHLQQALEAAADPEGARTLTVADLKTALKQAKIAVTESELRRLFAHFDRREVGAVRVDDVLAGLRPPLSAARRAVVDLAFTELDVDCADAVDFEDIALRYHAAGHPEVGTVHQHTASRSFDT